MKLLSFENPIRLIHVHIVTFYLVPCTILPSFFSSVPQVKSGFTEFYRVSSSFTEFYWVFKDSTGLESDFIWQTLPIEPCFTEFYRIFKAFDRVGSSFI